MMFASLSPAQLSELACVGLAAGLVGGLLGVGGGLVMIPAMALLLADAFGPGSFHLYKLAAIATSVVLSIPATLRHVRAGAIMPDMLRSTLPLAVIGVAAGVALASSPLFVGGQTHNLRRVFGGFLELVVAVQVFQHVRAARGEPSLVDCCPLPTRRLLHGLVVGLPTGVIAGFLGIGGGIWAVPAQSLLFGIRLRYAIANSSLMIIFVAGATVIVQSLAVSRMPGLSAGSAWWLTAVLAPTAIAGGWIGAGLTHRISTAWLRVAFNGLLAVTGVQLMRG
ncbi:Sulfite exporter TauE/SafE [Phycisphaerae bacterium RAS1]|nr:Sulfite exporter TauE/SafE [Phycisphaerae bacterium RAS1]